MDFNIDTFINEKLPIYLNLNCNSKYIENEIKKFGNIYKISQTNQSFDRAYTTMYDINKEDDVIYLKLQNKEKGLNRAYSCQTCSYNSKTTQHFKGLPSPCGEIVYKIVCESNSMSIYGTCIIPIEHIPSNCFYYDYRIFSDVSYILKQSSGVCAYINDVVYTNTFNPDHLTICLTSKHNPYSSFLEKINQNGKYYLPSEKGADNIINFVCYTSNDFNEIYENAKNDIVNITDVHISSCMMYENNRYYLCVSIFNSNNFKMRMMNRTAKNNIVAYCPSSYICILKKQVDVISNPDIETRFVSEIIAELQSKSESVGNTYFNSSIEWNKYRQDYKEKIEKTIIDIIKSGDNSVYSNDVAVFATALSYLKYSNLLTKEIYVKMFNACLEYKDKGKYKDTLIYLLSLSSNSDYISLSDIYHSSTIDIRIRMAMMIFLQINNNITSKSLYLDSAISGDIIQKTINGLVLTTSNGNRPLIEESSDINKWLSYKYKPIDANYGMLTESSIKRNMDDIDIGNIEFVIKMIHLQTVDNKSQFNDLQTLTYIRELYTSLLVNNFRTEYNIPNYMMCYGGYKCNSSDKNKLCDVLKSDIQDNSNITGYLLLEKIKGISFRKYCMDKTTSESDIILAICQIFSAIALAWSKKRFTHYDLHLDNIIKVDINDEIKYILQKKGYSSDMLERSNIIFKYFSIPTENLISIPSKHLFMIIDFGRSYIDDMPKDATFINKSAFIDSNKPDSLFDIFLFVQTLITTIINERQDLLVDDNNKIKENSLILKFIKKFLEGFSGFWIVNQQEMFEKFKSYILTNVLPINKKIADGSSFLYSLMKNEYKTPIGVYYTEKVNSTLVSNDFRTPVDVVLTLKKMFGTLLISKEKDRNIVFNFGNIYNIQRFEVY